MSFHLLKKLSVCLLLLAAGSPAQATIAPELLSPLTGDDPDLRISAVAQIAALGDPDAVRVLTALKDETAYASATGEFLIVSGGSAYNPQTGKSTASPDGIDGITVNNRLRAAVETALSGLRLFSADREIRLAAARELQKSAEPQQLPVIEKAYSREPDAAVRAVLQEVMARANLQSPEAASRLAAIRVLEGSDNPNLKPLLGHFLEKTADGNFVESDASVRAAAGTALNALNARIARTELLGNLFYGISFGSVLLLAAVGLAITFGLMGIINMAHGELLMIGAYTTYVCQWCFRRYFSQAQDAYLLLALPAAFLVTAAVGVLLERTVIRWLYGRPLETLLATWGISLILMQSVRSLFGAQNVEVSNPTWMSGGVTVLGSLVLPYNRIVIAIFSLCVVGAVWLILNRTRLGLFVRAVTQNRRMAACVGVPTARVDMLTFGLGSGIAGLGGVALSQLGNVGPDLGQSYIIDSFMVVVLGGVGQLAGTLIAAFGLGELNKFLEPLAGAVLTKIGILVFIIIFIQRRPQGLFALKGRGAE